MVGQITSLGREEEAWEPGTLPAEAHPEKQYQCPRCPSSFKRPENLKRHQRGHDDHNRFTCQICDKSFSRSDILGRHAAIHDRRERQSENPQRRRACYECARVRERCSRGEPCRRCAIKALHCLYPDEPPSKPTTSHVITWSPSASESGDYYDTAGISWLGDHDQAPLESPNTADDALSCVPFPSSSQWRAEEASSVSYDLQSVISSAWPHTSCHSHQLSHHQETPAAAFFELDDAVAPSDERLYHPGSTSEIGLKEIVRFLPSNAELDGMLGAYYDQTADAPSDLSLSCSNKINAHQLGSSSELQPQGHYIYRAPLSARQLEVPFYASNIQDYTSSPSTHTPILDQLEALDCCSSDLIEGYEIPAIDNNSAQVPGAGFDDHQTLFQPPPPLPPTRIHPHPRPAYPRLYYDFAEDVRSVRFPDG